MAQRQFLQLGLSPLLLPISWVYACVMYLRKKLYDFKILKSYKSKIPTICIGNISWGGTGKSPIVDYILAKMEEKQQKTVVLTRGYGEKFENYPLLLNHAVLAEQNLLAGCVSSSVVTQKDESVGIEGQESIGGREIIDERESIDGREPRRYCNERARIVFPDEALMLVRKHPQVDILIDPKRMRAAQRVMERVTQKVRETPGTVEKIAHGVVQRQERGMLDESTVCADVILMDDGFQHFALERDCDLVLLDKEDLLPQNPLGFLWEKRQNWNRVIPLGSWREQSLALHRASVFLLKCPEDEWNFIRQNAIKKLSKYQKPLFVFQIILDHLENIFAKEDICTKKNISNRENTTVHAHGNDNRDSRYEKTKAETKAEAKEKGNGQSYLENPIKHIKEYALLCAVGNPEQVQNSVEKFVGYAPTKIFFFTDHHDFKNECSTLYHVLEEMPIICTEKDAVKLECFEELRHAQNTIYVTKSYVQFHASEFYEEQFLHISPMSTLSPRISLATGAESSSLLSSGSSSLPGSPLSFSSHFDHWLDNNGIF